jgi:multidrug efflux system membrane fusion protein
MLRSTLIALFIAVAAIGWIVSGQFGLFANDDHKQIAAVTPANGGNGASGQGPELVAVRVQVLNAVTRVQEVIARGRTEAIRRVELRSEIPARVVAVEADKGATVKKGDVLVRLDPADYYARLAEAKALVRQRQIEYDAAKSLQAKGYRAETKLAEAMALLDAAKAQVKHMQVQVSRLTIRAPFDGIVDQRHAEVGDYMKEGNPVASLIDENPFLVIGHVSEREINRISLGDPGYARLVDGRTVAGKVRYLSSTADPATRTFRMELEVPNPDRTLRDGMTAEIRVEVDRVRAHHVTPAVLTLDDDGLVGVRLVGEGNIVSFHAANIVGTDSKGVWLTGLPETARVITVGQEYVRDGDRVRVSLQPEATAS